LSDRSVLSPLSHLCRVGVGSQNRPKLAAVRGALAAYAPRVEVFGVVVESGVSEQPVGWKEIAGGARQRALAAWQQGNWDLAVGIEDGLVELSEAEPAAYNIGCAAVTDGRRVSLGFSAAFAYPDLCSTRSLAERLPIGALFDAFWRERRGASAAEKASALSVGNIGKLTLGVLPRAAYGQQAVLCALVRFLNPDFYAGMEPSV